MGALDDRKFVIHAFEQVFLIFGQIFGLGIEPVAALDSGHAVLKQHI